MAAGVASAYADVMFACMPRTIQRGHMYDADGRRFLSFAPYDSMLRLTVKICAGSFGRHVLVVTVYLLRNGSSSSFNRFHVGGGNVNKHVIVRSRPQRCNRVHM